MTWWHTGRATVQTWACSESIVLRSGARRESAAKVTQAIARRDPLFVPRAVEKVSECQTHPYLVSAIRSFP